MYSKYKNKSFKNKLIDRFQRRDKGNIYFLLKNYLIYLKTKIYFKNLFNQDKTRSHIVSQIKNNSIIAEIGVWQGNFSKIIFNFCNPKELILIDPWIYNNKIRGCAPQVNGEEPMSQKYFDEAYKKTKSKFKSNLNVKIFKLSSIDASRLFNNDYFDYIYIDGEHSYEAVYGDLVNWYPKLKKNGYIFGDDYYWREEDDTFSLQNAYQDFIKEKNIKKWCVFKSQIMIKK